LDNVTGFYSENNWVGMRLGANTHDCTIVSPHFASSRVRQFDDTGTSYGNVIINPSTQASIGAGTGTAIVQGSYETLLSGDFDFVPSITSNTTRVINSVDMVTANSGTATVLSGSTNVTVSHGLDITPTIVLVTPSENATNPVTFWWASNITATQFDINVDADPGASNLNFYWRATYALGQ
jgi:hypothetical protein